MDNLRLPDFICIGVQKSGTTTLHDILMDHPQIYLPDSKEANFFDKNEEFNKGTEHWLKANFSQATPDQQIGVFTPDYLFYPYVAERISKAYGKKNLKLIAIFRDPVDRAYSHYLMSKRRGYESESFEKAIELEDERLNTEDYYQKNHFSYISRGRYLEQINRYLTYFDKDQFLFLSFEDDIRKNLDETLKRIETFIGVDHESLQTDKHSNFASGVRSKSVQTLTRGDNLIKRILKKLLSQKVRREMKQKVIELNENKKEVVEKIDPVLKNHLMKKYFLQDIRELEELTGLNLSSWHPKND